MACSAGHHSLRSGSGAPRLRRPPRYLNRSAIHLSEPGRTGALHPAPFPQLLKKAARRATFFSSGGEGGIDSFANAQSPLRGGSAALRRPLVHLPSCGRQQDSSRTGVLESISFPPRKKGPV